LKNCVLTKNWATAIGGGSAGSQSYLQNCALSQNSAFQYSGAADSGSLVNCTITANISSGYSSGYGAAVNTATLTNCIVWGNYQRTSYPNTNYANCTLAYCDADPLPPGTGNIDINPQLLADDVHLAATSPCIGSGTNSVVIGTDIDGQPWANPPSIGCDEWQPAPVVAGQPMIQIGGIPLSASLGGLTIAGQPPFSFWWIKDSTLLNDGTLFSGTQSTNLIANVFGPADTGAYQLIASNSFGVSTSAVLQVTVHAVDANGANPMPPFSSWPTAATNIQDAIDTAAAGDFVVVTNGLNSHGGRVMAGNLTNRVALINPLTVTSVNGPFTTAIQGAWDPIATNGPLAVRCAWLTNRAILTGFALQNGATLATGDPFSGGPLESGGGAWCVSTNGIVSNCVLTNNSAVYGGGISFGTLSNSLVINNLAAFGGGTYYCSLNNCTVVYNTTTAGGSNRGPGTYDGIIRNSIVRYNYDDFSFYSAEDNYAAASPPAKYSYSCTIPPGGSSPPPGVGNITSSPAFLDWFHIPINSPCYHAGSALYSTGTDLDGERWNNPPSIGCDEVVLANLVGPLAVAISAPQTNLLVNHFGGFGGTVSGRASWVQWSFGDGTVVTNSGSSISHQWTNSGNYLITFTAYNNDNPSGVSTNVTIYVVPPNTPQLQSAQVSTNGFQFQFAGQFSVNYTVQYTTNLTPPASWQTLQSFFDFGNGVLQITDSTTPTGTRFYRVLAQ
jgi:hypothetical protein